MRKLTAIACVLLTSAWCFPQCGSGNPNYRYVICDCTGFEAPGGACVGDTGVCQYSFPGTYCGSDDQGTQCYIGDATSNGCAFAPLSPKVPRVLSKLTQKNLAGTTTAVATCGNTPFKAMQVVTWRARG